LKKGRYRWILAGILVIALVAGLTGCSKPAAEEPPVDEEAVEEPVSGPRFGGVLRVGADSDVVGLDPHDTIIWQSHEVLRHIYEGLLAVDEGFGIIPSLAKEWAVSEDGLTYTFTLNPGVKFHNGKELKAEDVKFSFDRVRELSRAASYANIKEVSVTGDYEVQFTLSKPMGTFPMSLATPYTMAIVPSNVPIGPDGLIAEPVGTGPFTFVEWVPDRHVKMARFDDYWGGGDIAATGTGGQRVAYVDELVIVPIPEAQVRAAALEAGDVDWVYLTAENADRLRSSSSITVVDTGPSFEFWNFWFSMKKAPFNDVNMRMAFAYAINRDEMLHATTGGYGAVGNSMLLDSSVWFTPAHDKGPVQDLEKAKDYLEQSVYNGEKIVISTYKGYTAMDKMAVVAAAQLKAIGVDAEVEYLDWPSLVEKLKGPDFDVVAYGYGSFADPDQFYFGRLHRSQIFTGWDNAEFNEVVEKAQASSDFEERKALYSRAQEIIMEDMPLLVTFHEAYFYGIPNEVKGFVPWGAGFNRYWNMWIER
jgi:peptide/nickel transport system substrate-binding protein